jgi:hypothetical protein
LKSNKGFEDWGEVLSDEVIAAALIDRILHHCHLVNSCGNSYRTREHTEIYETLNATRAETLAPAKRRRKSRAVAAH